jgi:hypothetical protein
VKCEAIGTCARMAGGVILLVAIAAASGCIRDDANRYGSPPSSTAEPSVSASGSARPGPDASLSTEQQVLTQYKQFWKLLPRAALASSTDRRRLLATVAVDPELSVLLHNWSVKESDGHRVYGENIPLRQTIQVIDDLTLVRGCLDSSGSGFREIKSNRIRTKGIPRNPVLVNLRRGGDGVWRVSNVKYPGGDEC